MAEPATFYLEIITPERQFYIGPAEALVFPAVDGEMGVYPGHEPAVTAVEPGELPFLNVIPICAKTGAGLDQLADAVDTMFENETPCDGSILTNARQFDAIRRAYEAMLRALQGLQLGVTPDAVLTDVEQAMEAMGEITGATVREDITARIFERFCVGK